MTGLTQPQPVPRPPRPKRKAGTVTDELVQLRALKLEAEWLAQVDKWLAQVDTVTDELVELRVETTHTVTSATIAAVTKAAEASPAAVALRAALGYVMEAARATPSGAPLRQGNFPSDKIEQAAQNIEAAFYRIIDERMASRGAPEEIRFVAPDTHAAGYEAAVAAGAQARTEIFKRGDMLNSQDVADKLGVSRETVNQRRRNRELLALRHEGRGFRYPAWQIEPGVRDAIADVLVELGDSADCWAAYLFFTQPNPLLSGATPLQALKARKSAQVLRAAAAQREELA